MKTRIMLGCVLLCCTSATVGRSAEDNKTWKYTAMVVDTNGNPIADAAAKYYHYESYPGAFAGPANMKLKETAKTGTNGTFSFNLDRSSSTIVVTKPGLAFAWRQFYSPSETPGKVERIVLETPEAVAGTVLDENDKPMPNAEVWLATCFMELPREEGGRSYIYLQSTPAQDTAATRTDSEGRFTLGGFPAGSRLDLAARMPGKVLREADRQHLGPDTIRHRAGQQDIKLIIEPAASIEGRLTTSDPSQKLPPAMLNLQRSSGGVIRRIDPVPSADDGSFRFIDVPAGKYTIRAQVGTNQMAAWVVPNRLVEVQVGEVLRDIQLAATRGGLLEVTVLQQDNKKVMPGVSVNANAESFYTGGLTDSNGIVLLRLPEGECRVSAYQGGSRSESETARIELGLTNRLKIELKAPPIIAGVVQDREGKPMAGVEIGIFPSYGSANAGKTTDKEGRFEMPWTLQSYERDRSFFIFARKQGENLIATQDIDEDTRKVELRLGPGLEVAGRVEDPNGKAIAHAFVNMTVWSGNMGMSFGKSAQTDNEGRYQIRSLPVDRRITANANAKGFGSVSQELEQSQATPIELPPFVLKVADRILAGQVLDDEEKPVADANVHMYGNGQPNGSVRTDDQGCFKFDQVCEGSLRLSASKGNAYGSMSAEGGETNVVLQLGVNRSYASESPKRASLKGRPLPDLAAFGLAGNAVPKDKRLLVCLFDAEQRPSRRALRALADQHEALQKKGLVVLAIQAAVVDAEVVKGLQDSSPLPFPVGRVTEKKQDYKWVTEVDTLPWLILVNEKGQVLDEGFDIDSIETKSAATETGKDKETKVLSPSNLRMSRP